MLDSEKGIYDPVFDKYGMQVYTEEYVDKLRHSPNAREEYIIPNKGHQEEFLTTKAQIAIFAGVRGTGKSASLIMTTYPYVNKDLFSGAIFRNQKGDTAGNGGINVVSKPFLKPFGTYKSSLTNMKWDFNDGGTLSFEYYGDSYKSFTGRFRGKELPYIGIDEANQMPFKHFTYLFSCNRNSYGYPNIIRGACNPDASSWVFQFVRGEYLDKEGHHHPKYITDEGKPVQENNGKILYFFKYGDRPDECYWSDTKEGVYRQGKTQMDEIYYSDPSMSKIVKSPENIALSFTLIIGTPSDNPMVLGNNGEYIAKMGMMSREDKEKDLLGWWIKPSDSEALVSRNDIEYFFSNKEYKINDFRCVTVDVSGSGRGDPAVMMYWEGFHLEDVACILAGGETQKLAVMDFAKKHEVPIERICYDATGLGSVYEEYFTGAVNFVAKFPAFDKKPVLVGGRMQEYSNYENVRAQVFDNLAKRIREHGYSVDHDLLYRNLNGKMLIDHFREEYPAIAKLESNQYKFQAIPKDEMKRRVGHSPDFIDCWTLREYIQLFYEKKKSVKRIGAWML